MGEGNPGSSNVFVPDMRPADALTCYPEPRASLGEAPLWDAAGGRLYWVDCEAKRLFRLDPDSGATERWDLPHYPGSFALRSRGGMLMAYRNGLALIDLDSGDRRPVEGPFDFSRERLNDGTCDRRGRFWVGSMDRKGVEPVGSLFRVDPDLGVTRMAQGFVVSNGIAFSPDDRVLYHTDSRRGLIYAWDFDIEAGGIENRRVFLDYGAGDVRPDGCTVDSEGYLWVCEIGAWRVGRFDPEGRRDRSVALPVQRPASLAFGGPDLGRLYIATMRYGLSAEALEQQPLAGCLFAVDAGVSGLPEPRFAG